MIRFDLTGDSSNLEQAGARASKVLSGLEGDASKASKGMTSALQETASKGFGNLQAAAEKYGRVAGTMFAAAVAGLVAMVKVNKDAIDAQAKLAQQLNTTSASVATLSRAGELSGVGMEKIAKSSKALNVRLAQAAQGIGPAVGQLEKLGLTGEEIARLPLDQKIAAINQAIRETVPASEQAAVAARFFGESAGAAMLTLSGDTMAEARRQAELFGLALSDVDAAKVEMANDAFSTLTMAASGLAQQFTVKVAPILKAIGDLFLEMAKDAGGFGNVATTVFDDIVNALGFVMNAFSGIKRVADVVFNGIIGIAAKVTGFIVENVAGMLDTLSALPGVDFSETVASMQDFANLAEATAATAGERIANALTEPLAGDRFKDFVKQAEAAGQAAAEATVGARVNPGADLGPTQTEADRKAAEQQKALLAQRLETIRQANLSELEALEEKFIAENETIRAGLESRAVTEEQAHALSLGAAQRYADAKLEIEKRRTDAELELERRKEENKRQILSGALGAMTTLMNSGSRKLFEMGKVAAISQAIISTWTGATKALELGWPLGPIAAGAITLAGFANVDNIRRQQFGGGGGGGGGAVAPTQAINNAATPTGGGTGGTNAPQTLVNITLSGSGAFSREQVIGLWDQVKQLQSEGAVVTLV